MTEQRTLDQERAADALEKVRRLAERDDYGHYPSYVSRMPSMIIMSGLGQACAMMLAQARGDASDPHRVLFDHLQSWLCRSDHLAPYSGSSDLMKAIVNGSQRNYVNAQAETLAYLSWLKRFSQAYLQSPEGRDD